MTGTGRRCAAAVRDRGPAVGPALIDRPAALGQPVTAARGRGTAAKGGSGCRGTAGEDRGAGSERPGCGCEDRERPGARGGAGDGRGQRGVPARELRGAGVMEDTPGSPAPAPVHGPAVAPGPRPWTPAHWAPCPRAKMSPRLCGQPGIPAPAQRARRAARRCQRPRTGRVPALPGALCAGQAAGSLAAGQAAGERQCQPGVCRPVGKAGDRQPLPSPLRGDDVPGVGPGGSWPWQGVLSPRCSARCRARLALPAQRRWLAARGSSCGMPWQGAKQGN